MCVRVCAFVCAYVDMCVSVTSCDCVSVYDLCVRLCMSVCLVSCAVEVGEIAAWLFSRFLTSFELILTQIQNPTFDPHRLLENNHTTLSSASISKMDLPQGNQEEMMDAGLMHQSLSILGQKRLFSDDLDMSFPGQDDDRPIPKKKGRKKSFIWSHVVTDENGKVHCLHCGLLIRVNIGEKVSNFCVEKKSK